MRRAVFMIACALCVAARAHGQVREPAQFMDVFPAATAGAALGGAAGYQLGTHLLAHENTHAALAAGIVASVLGSATGAWLSERNDGTQIGFFDALSAAATSAVPAVVLAGAVSFKLPKSMRPYIGAATFSIFQGMSTAILTARHSRHTLADTQ